MHDAFDLPTSDALRISAKTGVGCDDVLPTIIERFPPPTACASKPLRVLLFDSWWDEFRGVLCLIEVLDGTVEVGDELRSAASGKVFGVQQLHLMRPLGPHALSRLGPGQVGCVELGMKTIHEASVGDTLSSPGNPQPPQPGFKRPQPMVFAGIYPTDSSGFEELQYAMGRFMLKDGSVTVEPEQSRSLGRGMRCGFLGVLHMEVVQQRLREEHNVDVIVTAPTVPLQATLVDGTIMPVLSPEMMPEKKVLRELREPMVNVTLLCPANDTGALIALCEDRAGAQIELSYLGGERALLRYRMPLGEIATEFHDRVKTLSSGFASVDYEEAGLEEADVVNLSLRVNQQPVDALSRIVRRSKAREMGKEMAEVLSKELDRQNHEVIIQAVADGTVVARQTIKALRKDVTAKCYGGDVQRKKKLLMKQKEGKKRAALTVGDVSIPQDAFIAVLSPNKRKSSRKKH